MIPKEECFSLSDAELVKLIVEDSDYLSCVYTKTKEYCIKFMQKQCNGIDIDEIKDIYHDAVLVLYDKAKTGNFELTSSIQTYLNSICRNQLLNRFKDTGKVISFPDSSESDGNNEEYLPGIKDWLPYSDFSINGEDDSESGERIRAIMKGMEVMKSSKGICYELLSMVYYQNKTMKQLVEHFSELSHEDSAKSKNYKCKEKLKLLTFEILNKLR